jgi:hypothetical protein
MTLPERIAKLVAVRHQEMETQREIDRVFDTKWGALRLGVVHTTLSEAGKALQDSRLGGGRVDHEDNAVVLRIDIPRPHAPGYNEYALRLAPDRKALKIVVSFTPKSLQDATEGRTEIEPLDLGAIDRELLESLCVALVEGLLDEVARNARANR